MILVLWDKGGGVCFRPKRETLEAPVIVKRLSPVEVIHVDVDKYPALGGAYGVVAIPDVFFSDKSGRIVDRMQNFEPPEAFVARVEQAFASPPNREGGNQ